MSDAAIVAPNGDSPPVRRQRRPGEARAIWLTASREDYRTCTKCGTEQPIANFPLENKDKGIRHTVCRTCWASRSKAYRASLSPERRLRELHGMRSWRFGLKPEDVAAIFDAQNGRCAICYRPMTGGRGAGAASLDHKRGSTKPRGFLCKTCNTNLSRYEEVQRYPEAYLAAIVAYIDKYA